jgi:putative membrane protein insertion efficiency factor
MESIGATLVNRSSAVAKIILMGLIRAYQILVSPLLGANCRFQPTCSHYMIGAIDRFGPLKGFWLGLRRLSRCHPWHEGGLDPIPELKKHTHNG